MKEKETMWKCEKCGATLAENLSWGKRGWKRWFKLMSVKHCPFDHTELRELEVCPICRGEIADEHKKKHSTR